MEGDDNTCVGALCWQKEDVCVFAGILGSGV